jgi:hypothetical protein
MGPDAFNDDFGDDFGVGSYCYATVDPDAPTPENTIGTVRLWSNENRSGVVVHICLSNAGNATLADEQTIGQQVEAVMAAAGVEWADYGEGRSFHCDVHVPQELVDRYS